MESTYKTLGRIPSADVSSLRPRMVLQLAGVCVFGAATLLLLTSSDYWLTGLWTGLAAAFLFMRLTREVSASEEQLVTFLQALKESDFTLRFSGDNNGARSNLNAVFSQLSGKYQELRQQTESQHRFLEMIVETVPVPIICFDVATGRIALFNPAAKDLFGMPVLVNLSGLEKVDPSLPGNLHSIRDGAKESYRLAIDNRLLQLSVISRTMQFEDRRLKLVAIQDVSGELAAREGEAWQKLIRVLTHEISNTAIPLTTLSTHVFEMLDHAGTSDSENAASMHGEMLESMKVVRDRSRSLMNIVTGFKSIDRVPAPVIQKVSIGELLDQLRTMFSRELDQQQIQVTWPPVQSHFIHADRNLTMQVLINVFKNSIDALEEKGEKKVITIQSEVTGNELLLSVTDNGCGIDPGHIDKVFVPFYSTKRTGSGIGLSISRQIMHRQHGTVMIRSSIEGTTVILQFPCLV